jgi:phytoene dehydrogenase-like protein
MPGAKPYDALIVGGGHNGLTCACYLAAAGLKVRILERPISNFLPLSTTQYLKISGSLAATQAEVARHSKRDAERLPDYYLMLERAATVLRSLPLETPPNSTLIFQLRL